MGAIFEGCGRDQLGIIAAVFSRNGLLSQPFNVAQISALFPIDQRDCDPFGSRTRRSTNAVNVAFGHVGQFVVDDV